MHSFDSSNKIFFFLSLLLTIVMYQSGVRDQPFGDAETKLGAMNRARAAFDAATLKAEKEGTPKPDFGELTFYTVSAFSPQTWRS